VLVAADRHHDVGVLGDGETIVARAVSAAAPQSDAQLGVGLIRGLIRAAREQPLRASTGVRMLREARP
jgi:hypothetical protein